jgi:glucose-1-phosphate thymidylyltransferase
MQPMGVLVVEDGACRARSSRAGQIDALEHIANRPIAELVIDELERAGINEVVVAVPRELTDEVRIGLGGDRPTGRVHLHFVAPDGPFTFVGALRVAAGVVGECPCIIHPAAGLMSTSLRCLAGHLSGDAPNVLVVTDRASGTREGRQHGQRVLRLVGDGPADPNTAGAGGVWLCGPNALRFLVTEPWSAPEFLDMRRVTELVAAAGGDCSVRLMNGWSRYAGDPADLLELNRIALDRLVADSDPPRGEGNRIEGCVRIDLRAMVEHSVIVGPAVIGAGARIRDAYIGPYTSIGAGAQIEGAEIERSIVQAGASIAHIGGRLMSSVVGRHAKVFRDFSLPRALRLRIGEDTEIGLC